SVATTLITSVGTIGSGTWQGTAIDPAYLTGVWFTAGNASTDPSNDFLGTTDAQDLAFRTNDIERIRITQSGNVGIGNAAPAAIFAIGANSEFRVDTNGNITRINNVAYSFPSVQATVANQVLTNDGNGTLTWGSAVAANVG